MDVMEQTPRGSLSGRSRNLPWYLFLAVAPILAFYPVLLVRQTVGRSHFATDGRALSIEQTVSWPVHDAVASSTQDETWLVYNRRVLAGGEIPVVNLQNGMGAGYLESLQPGPLYILNPLLLLLDTTRPRYFDIFCLIHIEVLVFGLFFLYGIHCRPGVAACMAVLIGLSAVTFRNLNLVHFRGFIWLPWMLYASMQIARGESRKSTVCILTVALLGSLTAGNLQDCCVSLLVTLCCACMALLSRNASGNRLRPVGILLAAGVGSLLIGSVAILPYFVSIADGNLFTLQTPERCLDAVPWQHMGTWLLPGCLGLFPFHPLQTGEWTRPQSDLPTPAFLLLALGAYLHCARSAGKDRRVMFWSLSTFVAVGLAKLIHFPIFDWLQFVPVLNAIKYFKYNLHLHVLLGLLGALGLERALEITDRQRYRAACASLVAVAVIIGGLIYSLRTWSDWSLARVDNLRVQYEIWLLMGMSALATIATAGLVCWKPRHVCPLLATLFLMHATVMEPIGLLPRVAHYTEKQGHGRPISASETEPLRALTFTMPNTNLLFAYEHLGVFDPIVNRYYREFMNSRFLGRGNNGAFCFHVTDLSLDRDLDSLRLLNVSRIDGYFIEGRPGVRALGEMKCQIEGALPRSFLLSDNDFQRLTPTWPPEQDSAQLASFQRAIEKLPPVATEQVGYRSFRCRANQDFAGYLVLNEAFSTNWSLGGEPPILVGGLWPAWPVKMVAGESLTVSYWPRGLTMGLWLAIPGIVLVGLGLYLCPRAVTENPQAVMRLAAGPSIPTGMRLSELAAGVVCLLPLLLRVYLPCNSLWVNDLPDLASISRMATETAFDLSTLGSPPTARGGTFETSDPDEEVMFDGWAVDLVNSQAARGLYIAVGDRLFPCPCQTSRPDVAHVLRNPKMSRSGFQVDIRAREFPLGLNPVSLKVITCDRKSYYDIPTGYSINRKK